MQMILSQILHSKLVKKSIPSFFQNQTPIISYSHMKTITDKSFNLKQSIKDLDLSCDCHVSDYRYEPVGHVVTGNLGIVGNRKLRKLLSKGPSYREQNNINWDTNQKIIKKAVRAYKVQWAKKKEKADSQTLDEWECRIIETVQARIDRLRKKKGKNQQKKCFIRPRVQTIPWGLSKTFCFSLCGQSQQ